MRPSPESASDREPLPDVPAPLAVYADRLLISTGLHAEDALLISAGQLIPPAEMEPIARALSAGWELGEEIR